MSIRTTMKLLRFAGSLVGILLALAAVPLHAQIISPATSITVETNQAVNFAADFVQGGDVIDFSVDSYSWTFGDGATGGGTNTVHSYATPGTYTVTVSASWSGGVCNYMDYDGVCQSYSYTGGLLTDVRTITVVSPPSISKFAAIPTSTRAGLPVTLSWTTLNATTLSITGVGAVAGTSYVVYPTATTEYTLTASNVLGRITSASVTVPIYTVGVSISPGSANLLLGESRTFTATVTPANQGVTWSATGGSLNGGTYTGTESGNHTVTAQSLEDSTKSGSAQVTVATVSVGTPIPSNGSVNAGNTLPFSAVVNGAVDTRVNWSVTGGGTISAGGLYSASTAGSYTVTATSMVDTSKSASTTVTVHSVVTDVTITPTSVSLKAGQVTIFTASASGMGGSSASVSWSATGGSIANGTYTAPLTAGNYTVTARSVQDTSKFADARVTVAAVTVGIPTPVNGSVDAGNTLQFRASVDGAVDTRVTWSVSGGGSMSPEGLFSASMAGRYTVTATSWVDATKSASTYVTVNAVVSGMTLTAPKASLKAGESMQLTATVSGLGGGSTAVTWTASDGSIALNGDGTFTAPIPANSTTVTVQATSVQDARVSRSVPLAVSAASVDLIHPANGTVNAGSTLSFSAVVSGAVNTGVTWSVSGGGTIDASGLFSATTAGVFTIRATSAADPTKSTTTPVTVNAVVTGLSVAPATATLNAGESLTFTATVSGLGGVGQAVAWASSGGTIAANGTFVAPNQPGVITITATSQQDSTKWGTAHVTVKGWVLKWKKDIVYVGTKEIAEVDAQGMHMTLVDHLGSPRFVVDGAGVVQSEQKFLPFGESLVNPTEAAKFAKGFTNHEQTDASGLIYMQARFYAPWYGRFLSPDPARDQHFDDTQSWNIYSYCLNQPTMKFDPDGQAPLPLQTNQWQIQGMRRAGMTESQIRETMRTQAKRETVAAGIGLTLGVGAELGAGAALMSAGRSTIGWLSTTGAATWQGAKDLFTRSGQAAQQAVNLAEHEAAGGHTILKHVGQSAADLSARLATSNIPAASTFNDLKSAEYAVSSAVSQNSAGIGQWLSGQGGQLVLNLT